MSKIIIAPSILAAPFGRLEESIKQIESSGADWLHIDVMDGHFVPPITFGSNMIELAKKSCSLPLDVHLMVTNPLEIAGDFVAAGADIITIHQEASSNLKKDLAAIKVMGVKTGVAIDPLTPVEPLFTLLHEIDVLLIMTVKAGYGGQSFVMESTDKIRAASNEIKKQGVKTLIEVDGGINNQTAKICLEHGATVFVSGTHLFQSSDMKNAISEMRSICVRTV